MEGGHLHGITFTHTGIISTCLEMKGKRIEAIPSLRILKTADASGEVAVKCLSAGSSEDFKLLPQEHRKHPNIYLNNCYASCP